MPTQVQKTTNITKELSNYRLPTQCCSNCVHSSYDMYGGVRCAIMPMVEIEPGAICDYYQESIA